MDDKWEVTPSGPTITVDASDKKKATITFPKNESSSSITYQVTYTDENGKSGKTSVTVPACDIPCDLTQIYTGTIPAEPSGSTLFFTYDTSCAYRPVVNCSHGTGSALNGQITALVDDNTGTTRTVTITVSINGISKEYKFTQDGSGGDESFTLTIVNNSNKTFYTNGWGVFYTKSGGTYSSHVSGMFKLSSQAAGRKDYCNPISIIAGGSQTFNNVITDDGFPTVYGREFEPDERGNASFTFWLAATVTADIPESQGGEILLYSSSNPSFVSTLTGGNTLERGGSYTLTITNLPYEASKVVNSETGDVTWYNPHPSVIDCN